MIRYLPFSLTRRGVSVGRGEVPFVLDSTENRYNHFIDMI